MTAPRNALVFATAVVAATVLSGATPALAKGTDPVRSSTTCSTGVIKLKAKLDHSRIEVETEVDTNRNGQMWSVKLADGGVTVWQGRGITHAPSGSFSIDKRVANRAGKDVITVRAARGRTVCSTKVSL